MLNFSLALRLARAVREKGKDKVEGGEDDTLCVTCLGPPVDPVEVSFSTGERNLEASSSSRGNVSHG